MNCSLTIICILCFVRNLNRNPSKNWNKSCHLEKKWHKTERGVIHTGNGFCTSICTRHMYKEARLGFNDSLSGSIVASLPFMTWLLTYKGQKLSISFSAQSVKFSRKQVTGGWNSPDFWGGKVVRGIPTLFGKFQRCPVNSNASIFTELKLTV